MPDYHYSARDAHGKSLLGKRYAETPEELAMALMKEDLTPIDISLDEPALSDPQGHIQPSLLPKVKWFSPKVNQDELYMFCRQMYSLTKAGIPIITAVSKLAETTRDKYLQKILSNVIEDLNRGRMLYLAFSQHPEVFTPFFVNLINVGENTGRLDEVFMHLANYLELQIDTKNKIKSALRYPVMVLAASFIALMIINVFVIPVFSKMFANFQGTLPLPTRMLIASSNFILSYWYILLFIAMIGLFLLRRYIKTPQGAIAWSELQLRIPIIGNLVERIIYVRFARLYALVLRSGITAVNGLELVAGTLGNPYVEQKVKSVADVIVRGNTIGQALTKAQFFSPLVIQMVVIGEESGNIDGMLDEAADYYQREVNYDLLRLSDAIEPILLVIMAAMVLVLALGVFLPMWDMASQMQGRH